MLDCCRKKSQCFTITFFSDQLELCIKDDLNEVEACLKEAEVSLRGVRTSLVASNKELKLQFTEFVVVGPDLEYIFTFSGLF